MNKMLRIFDKTMDITTFLAGLLLIFITLSVGLEVILRTFLSRPQMWVTEVTECLLLYITFLASAWLLREGGHVKVDIILNRFSGKAAAILGIFSSLIGVFVSLVLTIYGFRVAIDCFQRNIYTPSAMEIPVGAILIVIPVGSMMLLLQFIRRTAGFMGGYFIERDKPKP